LLWLLAPAWHLAAQAPARPSYGTGAAQSAFPQLDPAVQRAYRFLHDADHRAAQHEFERLVATRPHDLPARFGLLRVLDARASLAPALLPDFERQLERFIVDAEARYGRSADDAEATFYLAHVLLLRARYRVQHDKGIWGAARDGARAKRVSESYVRRHPQHVDGMLALGIYNYYVEIAPAFVRFIRTFLFLPSGDRAEGLRQIERVHAEGELFRYDAGIFLMEIYSTLEGRVGDASRIGQRMAADYPGNPQVHFELAELYAGPALEDYTRAAAEYEGAMAREEKRPGEPRPARYQARQGLASVRLQQWRVDDAIRLLAATIDRAPGEPVWVMPAFLLRRGNYRALLGDPAAPQDAQRVRAEQRWQAWHKYADEQLVWIQRRRGAETLVYAALIPGNRLVAERRWDEAAAAYAAVARDHSGDAQVRYRQAYLRFARGDHAAAVPEFVAVSQQRAAPVWLKAQALLYVARAHDVAGRRAEAIRTYERVVEAYERENAAFAARIGIVTPYTRPGM
jgi:tetratricopeptide (TPR) repeat protein